MNKKKNIFGFLMFFLNSKEISENIHLAFLIMPKQYGIITLTNSVGIRLRKIF